MTLFNLKKKKSSCDCDCNCGSKPKKINVRVADTCCGEKVDGVCCVKVLGSGCKNCHTLFENVKAAVKNFGLEIEPEYITDMQKIMEYGVMNMPALVVNEKVVSMGKVLKPTDVEKLLK